MMTITSIDRCGTADTIDTTGIVPTIPVPIIVRATGVELAGRGCGRQTEFFAIVLLHALLTISPLPAYAGLIRVEHDIVITLDLDRHRLHGIDRMSVQGGAEGPIRLHLRSEAPLTFVTVNGQAAIFSMQGDDLWVSPGPAWKADGRNAIEVRYAARYDDPVPERPVNSDNPGYGVSGSIGPQGAFLLAGAGWYPGSDARRETFTLTVTAPRGVLAVTSGRNLGHVTQEATTVSSWRVDEPVEGLSLAAGHFRLQTRTAGAVTLATYFTAANAQLAPAFLDASARYMEDYNQRFGPYPFPQFAVVENFFPTGYGFPGYTLVGGQILGLPFMLGASLSHEIAHNWWGNGVWVDSAEGNWCEGLTTYLADYRLSEARGPQEAADHRLQILRGYATLVDAASDFPLAHFRSREDPVTQSVGYGKGAMVFHMLRQLVGEEHFWGALRDLYSRRRFQAATWSDLQTVFEVRAGRSLADFFQGWVKRPGALQMEASDLDRVQTDRGWRVSGRVRQHGASRVFSLPIELETATRCLPGVLVMEAETASFVMDSSEEPLALHLDPRADLFRQLSPREIPATVNRLKATRDLLVVYGQGPTPELTQAVSMLLEGLGVTRFRTISEAEPPPGEEAARDLLLVGWPRTPAMRPSLPPELVIDPAGISLRGEPVDRQGDVLFAMLPHPWSAGHVTGLLLFREQSHVLEAARKITHYGRYSYLHFRDGQNRAKGSWPPADSPLTHRWVAAGAH